MLPMQYLKMKVESFLIMISNSVSKYKSQNDRCTAHFPTIPLFPKNLQCVPGESRIKNHNFYSIIGTHAEFILTKFPTDWVKIMDFLK